MIRRIFRSSLARVIRPAVEKVRHNPSPDLEIDLLSWEDLEDRMLDLAVMADLDPASANMFAAAYAVVWLLTHSARKGLTAVLVDFQNLHAEIRCQRDIEGDRPVFVMDDDRILCCWDRAATGARQVEAQDTVSRILATNYGAADVSEEVMAAAYRGPGALKTVLRAGY